LAPEVANAIFDPKNYPISPYTTAIMPATPSPPIPPPLAVASPMINPKIIKNAMKNRSSSIDLNLFLDISVYTKAMR